MSPRPTTHPPARRLTWRLGTPLAALGIGALLVTSSVNAKGTDLRAERYTDMAGLVAGEKSDTEERNAEVRSLSREVDQLSQQLQDAQLRTARKQVAGLRAPSGFRAVQGPGITVTLSDAPKDVIEASQLNVNLFVVHQQDIQAVVNAMFVGGAEAVTINGQRLISTTGIKCEGNAVQLHGVPYAQPYKIAAIGDPEKLRSAIDEDAAVKTYRSDAADPEVQIGWSLDKDSSITAPAYDGLLDLAYARPQQPA